METVDRLRTAIDERFDVLCGRPAAGVCRVLVDDVSKAALVFRILTELNKKTFRQSVL